MKHLFLLLLFTSTSFAASLSDFGLGELQVTPLGNGTRIKVTQGLSEIGKFRLSNAGSRGSIELGSITFRNYGNSDLSRSLEQEGVYLGTEKISTAAQASRREVKFLFDSGTSGGFLLRGGESVILTIRAQIAYARTNDSIQLGVRYPEDIEAVDISSGFQIPLADTFRLETYPLHPGDLSVLRSYYGGRASSGASSVVRRTSPFQRRSTLFRRNTSYYNSKPRTFAHERRRYDLLRQPKVSVPSRKYTAPPFYSGGTFAPGAKDVVFFQKYFSTKTSIGVQGLRIDKASGSRAADKNNNGFPNEDADFEATFTNFRLLVDGRSVDSTKSFENGSLFFDGFFEIDGSVPIMIVGRITQEATRGDRLKFQISRDGFLDPRYLRTGNPVGPSSIQGGTGGGSIEAGNSLKITK